jgi:hypothetical protein
MLEPIYVICDSNIRFDLGVKPSTRDNSLPFYFLEKNDMMFPCPFGAAAFLPFAVMGAAETFAFWITGSSSEKDSQAASSRVTVNDC